MKRSMGSMGDSVDSARKLSSPPLLLCPLVLVVAALSWPPGPLDSSPHKPLGLSHHHLVHCLATAGAARQVRFILLCLVNARGAGCHAIVLIIVFDQFREVADWSFGL